MAAGYADKIARSEIAGMGHRFVAKPFTSNGLTAKVREVPDSQVGAYFQYRAYFARLALNRGTFFSI